MIEGFVDDPLSLDVAPADQVDDPLRIYCIICFIFQSIVLVMFCYDGSFLCEFFLAWPAPLTASLAAL